MLALTAREAFGFFRHKPKVQSRLRPLLDVGLDYLRLGQPATTLSGGEAQRLKLADSLAATPGAITRAASKGKRLYLFDEPTTGLHPLDVDKLAKCFHDLADQGHTAVIVEHNPRVWVASDWIIDLGPRRGVRRRNDRGRGHARGRGAIGNGHRQRPLPPSFREADSQVESQIEPPSRQERQKTSTMTM